MQGWKITKRTTPNGSVVRELLRSALIYIHGNDELEQRIVRFLVDPDEEKMTKQ